MPKRDLRPHALRLDVIVKRLTVGIIDLTCLSPSFLLHRLNFVLLSSSEIFLANRLSEDPLFTRKGT